MKTIGIVANTGKPESLDALGRLAAKAHQLGLKLVACDDVAGRMTDCAAVQPAALASRSDVLVALGGDGTLLNTARLVDRSGKPILGVNLGRLGFLTSVGVDAIESALDRLVRGDFSISERAVMDCVVWRGKEKLGESRALNDVVAGWGQSSRIITLDVSVDHAPMTSYRCDGVIVSTPTGSTGHSLSAGGPILHPETSAFLINVICPHTLSARPVVLPDRHVIGIAVTASGKELLLSVDGQEQYTLREGDRFEVRRSAEPVRLIQMSGYNYFDVLRQKLQWR